MAPTKEKQFELFWANTKSFLELINPVLEGLPNDLQIAIHLCRGNCGCHLRVPWTTHDILSIFAGINNKPSYLLIEWDDDRAGSLNVYYH
jgi:methionine synthase II (cobalamin-independent)